VFPSSLDIGRNAARKPIADIAGEMGLGSHLVEPYGRDVMKISLDAIEELADRPKAKYVVVTAITPTPLGEGKTTTSVGLSQGMHHIGKRAVVTLRQSSMGPTLGIKGGAAGGGYSQVVPMEKLNLHLTGDIHAVTAAHNLLSAMLDNHLFRGNALGLDLHGITWRRVLDMNDRSLRNIVTGLGGRGDGIPRETGFDITAASEVMTTLALTRSLRDLRERLGRIVVGYTKAGDPVTAEDLDTAGAMTVLLKDAIMPNLVQTLEHTPAIVHCGPFGNIATGASSVIGDKIALRCGDFVITEAGFGADMGAERFFNIKCRSSGERPDAAVVVSTVRALKAHSASSRSWPASRCRRPVQGGPGRRCAPARPTWSRTSASCAGTGCLRWCDQHDARRQPQRARRHPRDRRGGRRGLRRRHPLHRRRARRHELAEAVVEAANKPSEFQFLYPTRRACARRSRRSPPRSTAQTVSTTPPPPPGRSTPTRRRVSASCRSAWPRRTCRCRRTRRSKARRPAGACRCGGTGLGRVRVRVPHLR
jgi:formate--tetrahydrofolate ligase